MEGFTHLARWWLHLLLHQSLQPCKLPNSLFLGLEGNQAEFQCFLTRRYPLTPAFVCSFLRFQTQAPD